VGHLLKFTTQISNVPVIFKRVMTNDRPERNQKPMEIPVAKLPDDPGGLPNGLSDTNLLRR